MGWRSPPARDKHPTDPDPAIWTGGWLPHSWGNAHLTWDLLIFHMPAHVHHCLTTTPLPHCATFPPPQHLDQWRLLHTALHTTAACYTAGFLGGSLGDGCHTPTPHSDHPHSLYHRGRTRLHTAGPACTCSTAPFRRRFYQGGGEDSLLRLQWTDQPHLPCGMAWLFSAP